MLQCAIYSTTIWEAFQGTTLGLASSTFQVSFCTLTSPRQMVQCNQVSTSIRTQQAQSMSEHLRASGNKIVSISSSRVAFCSYKVNSFHMSDDVINLWDFYKRFAATMSTICHNTLLIAFWVLHQAVLKGNNLGLLSAADNKPIPENNIKRGWLPSEGEGARVRWLIRWKRHFFPNQASRGGGR